MIAFRILHILAGVLWVGGTALFFFYVEPTLTKLGPDAQKFIDEVIVRRKLPMYFAAAATVTVLAGVIMYWRDSAGLSNGWMTTTSGIVFGLGGLAALVSWALGLAVTAPSVKAVGAIGAEMRAAGAPPSAELMGRMHAAQERVRQVGLINLVLVFFAVICMASARYLG